MREFHANFSTMSAQIQCGVNTFGIIEIKAKHDINEWCMGQNTREGCSEHSPIHIGKCPFIGSAVSLV